MEAFAPLPIDLFADTSNYLQQDDDPYFSLSQFDLELQQQAQAAILQQDNNTNNWQDFDKYLPIDTKQHHDFAQAQPIFMNNSQPIFNTFNNNTLFYEPIAFQQLINEKPKVKEEYSSPESVPIPADTPQTAHTSTPPLDLIPNWPPAENAQAKVPIQRLKSTNTIITNAVNAALSNNSNNTVPLNGRQHKKTAHNAIERRYRNNINDRITELKNAVPALLHAKLKTGNNKRPHGDNDEDDEEDGQEYLDGVAVATKLNKATILRKATEYIHHLKKSGDDVRRENETLQHILAQLPGGSDILQHYHLQKQQRETQVLLQKEEQRQLKQQNTVKRKKKRTKYADDYESSSSDPLTPPPSTSRVFMAVFMSVAFFSTSPLANTSEPHPTEYRHEQTGLLSLFFNLDNTWSIIRTVIFIFCICQFFFSFIFTKPLKLKRVAHPLRIHHGATSGNSKRREMYQRLSRYNDEFSMASLMKESILFFSHHVLGYDIITSSHHEKDTVISHWIQLNEIRCVGGDPAVSRLSLLHSCLRMINLVDSQITEEEDRAYITAALEMSLIFPPFIATKLSDYFKSYVDVIPNDDAWDMTVALLGQQTGLLLPSEHPLHLSYQVTSPSVILSTFHYLYILHEQFLQLITTHTKKRRRASKNILSFDDLLGMLLEEENDLVFWLATVGSVIESIWLKKTTTMPDLQPPPSLTCSEESVGKQVIVHTLLGTILHQPDNLAQADTLRRSYYAETHTDLESMVVALAEFAATLMSPLKDPYQLRRRVPFLIQNEETRRTIIDHLSLL